jgi:hypothetical protein
MASAIRIPGTAFLPTTPTSRLQPQDLLQAAVGQSSPQAPKALNQGTYFINPNSLIA